jgi:hypothetical protein
LIQLLIESIPDVMLSFFLEDFTFFWTTLYALISSTQSLFLYFTCFRLRWLFETSDVLYPSLYMSRHKQHHYEHVHGRLVEARRLAKPPRIPLVIPYVWYLYQDQEEYLTVVIIMYSLFLYKKRM